MRANSLLSGLLFGSLLALLCPSAPAALVWSPETGWRIEGGALQGIVNLEPAQHENALELMNSARSAQEKDAESGRALDLYQDVISEYPQSAYAPEAVLQRGLIYAARGQFSRSEKAFNTVLNQYPDYPNFNLLVSSMFATAQLIQDGATFYLWGSIPWFTDTRVALNLYESVLKNAPYSDYAPLALMNMALLYNRRGEPEDAIHALDRLTNNYPQSVLSSDAYMRLAETYSSMVQGPDYDQGATRQAMSYYQDYLILFPDGPEVTEARAGVVNMRETLAKSKYGMGEFFYRYRTDLEAGGIFFNESITEAPLSVTAQEARVQLDRIEQGILAPAGPIDWIFGRYPAPNRQQQESATQYDLFVDQQFRSQTAVPTIDESNLQRAAAGAQEAADAKRQRQQAGAQNASGNRQQTQATPHAQDNQSSGSGN